LINPRYFDQPSRISNPRSARTATHRRKVRSSRARYASIGRVCVGLSAVLSLLMTYVVLTSSLTGLSYAVAHAQHQREALQEETIRLDDRLAEMRSDDRLAGIAAKLGMRDPQQFAMVHISVPRVADSRTHFTMLSSLAGLFVSPLARQQR
jgi:hypothetical protein